MKLEHVRFLRFNNVIFVGFEVFTAATMKNAVFWDVAPCGFIIIIIFIIYLISNQNLQLFYKLMC
jgi:uncharacterized integral membrane protein